MKLLSALLVAGLVFSAAAGEPLLSPNAPKDRPASVAATEMEAFEAAIAPYIAQAKSTYPAAKARFLTGLPKGQNFFVTTRLRESNGDFEQVFIAVRSIQGGTVSGRIASDIRRNSGFKNGDPYSFPESEVLDWLITRPDGSEEGNFVGKFLDGYRGSGA